tara:strand:- start:193 stop:1857 length:1665 start_codon:yes stop_codon:yes gene_type:complete
VAAASIIFLIIIIRLYFIQIKSTDCFYFNEGACKENILIEASKRQVHLQKITAHRGIIFDRNNNILAMSLPSKTLCINPSKLYKKNYKEIKNLSILLNISDQELFTIISKHKDKKEYYLKRHIEKKLYLKIKNKINNPFIYFINENKRIYLGGKPFSNIIGFTNVDDKGQEGIEYISNDKLSPISGLKRVKKDNIGRTIETIEILKKPSPGRNIILTLDKRLQIIGYEILRKYINKFKADSGSIVLVESSSGNILSMANYPSFDPENRHTFKGNKIKNRVVHDLIEPGSTIKPLIVYAGLENKIIEKSSIIDTSPGVIKIEGQEIKDWKYLGQVTPRDVIKLSSNIGAAKISRKLSKKELINFLDTIGFGQSLFLNLPGSKNGFLPTVSELSDAEHFTLGYGYGLSSSLMHLISAYLTLANNGNRTQLKYLQSKEGYNYEKILNEKNTSIVLDMMKDVVHSDNGTGKKAKVDGYTIYGKTGTVRQIFNGEYSKNRHNALFVGIIGNPSPEYVAAVIIRNPKIGEGSGGRHAAPVFSEFIQHSMRIINDIDYAKK